MTKRRFLYGLTGLLSLLGFIGLLTDDKFFLFFFAFAVDFEYFFIKSDEMLEEYMNKSASRAFYLGMFATAIFSLISFFSGSSSGKTALVYGLAFGWITSVIVYFLSTAYYGIKEKWSLAYDKEQN